MEVAKARKIRQHGPRERTLAKGPRVQAARPAKDRAASKPAVKRVPGEHTPVRTCIGCRQDAGRGELLRLVEAPDGQVVLDARSRIGGRGAWVHPTKACIEMAAKRHAAERSLKIPVRDVSATELVAGVALAYRRRIDSLITTAARSRGLVVGVAASVGALETTKVPLVLVAIDAGSERKAVEGDGAERARAVRVFGTKEELGRLFRRSEVAMIAVTEPGIAAELESTIDRLAGLED